MRSEESLERQIRFVLEADRLKTVARQSRITDGSRHENSAEHSWHLAVMALALAGHAPPGTDLARVMAMLVVHDMVEIDAGDLFVYSDSAALARQAEAERAAADRIGINATDLNCLNILSFSGHMTAGELARATGLTTASITGVIDRLEEAGYVTRERDPHDRRRVVVTLSLDRAMRNVASVFLPVMRDWRELATRYSNDELRLIVDFYARMEQVFRNHLIRLRTEGRDG